MPSQPKVTRIPTQKAVAVITRAADIEPRSLDPVWPGVLWAGKPTLIAGDPGEGKSMLTCNIAARVTTGDPWPCSAERRPPADVMMLSAEDDPEDTIVPRLIAAGADLERVCFVRGIVDGTNGAARNSWLSLDKHTELLDDALTKQPARLIIIDPLSAYLGGGTDSNNEGDVRTVLALLADLAGKHRASVLAIRHLNKSQSTSPQQRVIGSVAFTAAARAVYGVVRDPDDDGLRLFLCVKNNLAADTAGYRYVIKVNDDGVPYAEWDDARENRTAAEILGAGPDDRRVRLDGTIGWLTSVLAPGPIPSRELRERADDAGHSWRTVERARAELKGQIKIERSGGIGSSGHWQWRLVTPPSYNPANPISHTGGLNGDSANTGLQADLSLNAASPPNIGGGGLPSCPRCNGEGCRHCGETGLRPGLS